MLWQAFGRWGGVGGASAGGGSGEDPYFNNVVLLSSFDGSNGSTTFTDESNTGHTLTANGNAQLSSAQSKFGTASLHLDGTGDYVSIPSSQDWNLGAANYTFEMWVRPDALTAVSTPHLYCQGASGNVLRAYLAATGAGGEAGVEMSVPGTGGDPNSVVTGDWHHIVAERYQDIGRTYVNGVMTGKSTGSTAMRDYPTASMMIGALYDGSNTLNGYISEVRMTYGIARYNSDSGYVVPTEPFPRGQAPQPGDYRYWKIAFNTSNSGPSIIFTEIDVKESHGGTDISQCARITGSAGHFASGEEVRYSADGDAGTFWQPSATSEIVYDFFTKRTLNEIVLTPHGSFLSRTPQNVEVLGSNDGTNYTSVQSWSGFTSWSGARTLNW